MIAPLPRPHRSLRGALRSAWVCDLALAACLVAWYYRYGLGALHTRMYDTFDQKAMIYLLEWLHHSFFGSGHLAATFDPNILYPNTNVLAWSDSMLGFAPWYSLFRAFTSDPIFALNEVALLGMFVACLGMLRLGRELTGQVSAIAAIVGAAGLLVASQEGHFQLKAIGLVAWALYFMVRWIRGDGKAAPWLVVVAGWLFLCSIYFAIMLAVFVVTALAAATAVGGRRFLRWGASLLASVPPVRTAGVLAVTLVPVGWTALHYLQVKSQFGGYQLDTFVTFSARLGSLLDAPPTSFVYRSAYSDWGSHEARLCFGMLTWMGIAFLALGWRRWTMPLLDRRIIAVLALGALLSTVLALGPYERYALERGIHIPLPAYLYAKLFPGFSALRTVGRFGIFAALFMSVLAELGLRKLLTLLDRPSGETAIAYAAIAGLFVVDQSTLLNPQKVDLFPRRPVYEAIRDQTPPDAVILELPVVRPEFFQNISWWHEQMLGSTLHWRRVPVGFTSQESGPLSRLATSWRALESGSETPDAFVKQARELGITHLVVDEDLMPATLTKAVEHDLAADCAGERRLVAAATVFDCRSSTR